LSGAAILEEFIVNDADLVGEIIEVTCADVSIQFMLGAINSASLVPPLKIVFRTLPFATTLT
jgi:hypothetical protein